MEKTVIKGPKSVKVPLSIEEYEALERLGEKYYTQKVNKVIKHIIRDEMHDFEEKNRNGLFVTYDESNKDQDYLVVYFDPYTMVFIREYSEKMNVSQGWFVKYLLRPHIKGMMQTENGEGK